MNPQDIERRLRAEARGLSETATPDLAQRVLAGVRQAPPERAPIRFPRLWPLAVAAVLALAVTAWLLRPAAEVTVETVIPMVTTPVQAPLGELISVAHRPLQAEATPLDGELSALGRDLASVAGFLARVPPGIHAD